MSSEASRLYALKSVVTGASDGIGEAVARTFARQGAEVLAVDEPDSGVERVFRRVRGIRVAPLEAARFATADLRQVVSSQLDGLDILVNNFASQLQFSDGPEGDGLDSWLRGIAATSRGLLPLLEKSPAGRIINVGPLRSSFGRDTAAAAAVQAALAELTAAQAAEFGASGITANYIQPGSVMTPVSRELFEADRPLRDWCIARSAARRLGEPLDVAKVALFLASDDAVFVSGTGVVVDGGAAAGNAAAQRQ